MKNKLTLTIDKSVIDRAKSYAKKSGRSLSEIIENYLIFLVKESSSKPLSPKLRNIVGSITLPPDYDVEDERRTYHEEKH